MARPVAFATVNGSRSRTADLGPAPEGHPAHGRQVGRGAAARPARWSLPLPARTSIPLDAAELEALEAWVQRQPPHVRREIAITRLEVPEADEPTAPVERPALRLVEPDPEPVELEADPEAVELEDEPAPRPKRSRRRKAQADEPTEPSED